MQYSKAIEKLYGLAPRGMQLGLEPIRAAAEALGAPHRKIRAVQVAGTNGKGTTASLIAGALAREGQNVGLFTSPHLHRFTERIRLGGQEVERELLARTLTRIFDLGEREPGLQLTFFETATLAALLIFVEAEVNVAVLEVGLGGRLDSTSVVEPEIAVITSIGLDHTQILGDSLAEIAAEKAAIAINGRPLIVGALPPEAQAVVERTARETGAALSTLGREFQISDILEPPWPGAHQRVNGALAFEVYRRMSTLPGAEREYSFSQSLRTAKWPGRFESLEVDERHYLLDGAHNTEAMEALVAAIDESQIPIEVAIFGAAADKPVPAMLDALRPHVDQLVLAPPPLPRAFDPATYAVTGERVAPSVEQALSLANELCPERGTILITGSLFTVGEARRLLLGEEADPPIRL